HHRADSECGAGSSDCTGAGATGRGGSGELMLRVFKGNLRRGLQLGLLSIGLIALLGARSEEHTSELQSPCNLVCRLLLEKQNYRVSGGGQKNIVSFDRRVGKAIPSILWLIDEYVGRSDRGDAIAMQAGENHTDMVRLGRC